MKKKPTRRKAMKPSNQFAVVSSMGVCYSVRPTRRRIDNECYVGEADTIRRVRITEIKPKRRSGR